MDVMVLGRTIGVASGWDYLDNYCDIYFDFVCADNLANNLKAKIDNRKCDLAFNYDDGYIQITFLDVDNEYIIFDIIDVLKNIPLENEHIGKDIVYL